MAWDQANDGPFYGVEAPTVAAQQCGAAGDVTGLVEKLRFHGRYATESQDKCAARKNAERDQAATTLLALSARAEAAEVRVKEMEAALDVERQAIQAAFSIHSRVERAARSLSPIKEAGNGH